MINKYKFIIKKPLNDSCRKIFEIRLTIFQNTRFVICDEEYFPVFLLRVTWLEFIKNKKIIISLE